MRANIMFFAYSLKGVRRHARANEREREREKKRRREREMWLKAKRNVLEQK
jgi:hypothetical protein